MHVLKAFYAFVSIRLAAVFIYSPLFLFLFSLYPNDLMKVTSKKNLPLKLVNKESTLSETRESKEELLYYIGADISTASLSGRTHDNTYALRSMGIKTLEKLEKYTVDVLGEVHRIEREPRMPFTQKRS